MDVEIFGIEKGVKAKISFCGGGGKTSTLFALAKELKSRNLKVLVTTTTSIFYPHEDYDDIFLLDEFLKLRIDKWQPEAGSVTVLGTYVNDEDKLKGISKEYADELYRNNIFDAILVEADGSKRKPIKAPDAHEPVIPECSTAVVGVIGFDCYGKPIGPEWVHRPHLLAGIAGRIEGDVIDSEVIQKLVLSSEGLFKSCPAHAQKIVFINKVETLEQRNLAEGLGNSILKRSPDIKRVVIGSIQGEFPQLFSLSR